MSNLQKTPLYTHHQRLNAKIVDFGGWALPVNYGSQIEEHNAVRNDCGVFDVSHMTVSDIVGAQTINFLSKLLANDITKATKQPGKALYSCMLNENGGVIDDLIVYYLNDEHCRLVTNAGTRDKDIAWIKQQAQAYSVEFTERPNLALIAVQGPNSLSKCSKLLETELVDTIQKLNRFQGSFFGVDNQQFVGRTGYTGEDGIELIITKDQAIEVWNTLTNAGIQACGLGARDTLRLEAGMSLYGNDLDEQNNPIESGLSWTVKLNDNRDFIGKEACLKSSNKQMIGLVLLDKGVLRGHQKVHFNDTEIGEITSGTFSPTLQKSIALARINTTELELGQTVLIAVRKKFLQAQVVPYPFIKNGRAS